MYYQMEDSQIKSKCNMKMHSKVNFNNVEQSAPVASFYFSQCEWKNVSTPAQSMETTQKTSIKQSASYSNHSHK